MSWIEFTCGECGNKYTEQTGDTDERVCDECLNHEDEMADYGPPYSMANPTGEPVGSQPYPKWNDKAKEYDGKDEEDYDNHFHVGTPLSFHQAIRATLSPDNPMARNRLRRHHGDQTKQRHAQAKIPHAWDHQLDR